MTKKQIWIGIVFIALILVAIGWMSFQPKEMEQMTISKITVPELRTVKQTSEQKDASEKKRDANDTQRARDALIKSLEEPKSENIPDKIAYKQALEREGFAEYKHEEKELTALESETFDLLEKKFPSELLDTKLKTLRSLSESTAYITFLEKKYPNLAPFSDFVDFDARVLPPKDRYLKFCQLYLNIPTVEEITDDEQSVIHHIATSSWTGEASQRGKDRSPLQQEGKPYRLGHVLAFKPIGREILARRKADSAAFAAVLLISWEHLDEDVRWIKTLFEKHGKSDGCLRIAVQDPMLFYRILYAFSTDTTFLKCLYDPVDTDAERHKQLDKKYEKRL